MKISPASNWRFSRTAFTLIELVLVIILLSVIAAVSIPSFSNTYSRMQLKYTAESVQYLMNYAQSRAVMKSRPHRLQWNEGLQSCWLEEEIVREEAPDPEEPSFVRLTGKWGKAVSVPPDVQASSSLNSFVFHADGTIDKGVVTVCNDRHCYSISTQERRGRVMLFSDDEALERLKSEQVL